VIEIIILVLIVSLPVYYFVSRSKSSDPVRSHFRGLTPSTKVALARHKELLLKRWEPNEPKPFTSEPWRHEAVTQNQLQRLKEDGFKVSSKRSITKGMASDVIGTIQSVDEHDQMILAFFEVECENKSETEGLDLVARLMADTINQERWRSGPTTEVEIYFCELIDPQAAKNISSRDAKNFIEVNSERLPEPLRKAIPAIESWWAVIQNEEDRRQLGIRKPTAREFIDAAVEALIAPEAKQRNVYIEEIVLKLIDKKLRARRQTAFASIE